jgi:hypothetical protein
VARHHCGSRAAFGTPGSVGRNASDQHHRLGVRCQGQRFLGAFTDQFADVLAQCVAGLLECLGYCRVIAPSFEHANRLRTLAREDECERFHTALSEMQWTGLRERGGARSPAGPRPR